MKAAKIVVGGAVIDCTVRDLSMTGAALDVPSQVGIPAKFTLIKRQMRLRGTVPLLSSFNEQQNRL